MKKWHIHIPEHPYRSEITSFGRDELSGLAFNTLWTGIIEYMLNNFSSISWSVKKSFLSFWWPVVEKIWFFVPHLMKEIIHQRKNNEKDIKKLLKNTLSGWSDTLVKDILLHDPLYIAMMYIGQEYIPETPWIILSFVSFISALLIVWIVKVGFDEWKFRYFCHTLQKKWFLYESYYESRIHMHTYEEAEKIFESLMKEFTIEEKTKREYNDIYYAPTPMKYLWWRTARVRERTRTSVEETLHTWQLLFTKPREFKTKNIEQYRYFPIKKDKFAFKASSIEEVSKILSPYKYINSSKHVHFTRRYGNDPMWLLMTMDTLSLGNEKKYVIELKVHTDLLLLKEAIKKVLIDTRWEQRTEWKDDL